MTEEEDCGTCKYNIFMDHHSVKVLSGNRFRKQPEIGYKNSPKMMMGGGTKQRDNSRLSH